MILTNDSRLSQLLGEVLSQAPADQPVYLVGGAVRDLRLGRPVHDLDFGLPDQVRSLARRVANALGGHFYMLDEGRSTARVIVHGPDGDLTFLDFCTLRGPDLESDLRDRDFTINAIAFDLRQPDAWIDPTGGIADLQARVLRPCSAQSFQNDPVRILRGVRLAQGLEFRLLPETLDAMRPVVSRLPKISSERRRDEFLRILEGRNVRAALRLLDDLKVLGTILPELTPLKGMTQSAPHVFDGWEHTLAVLAQLERVWAGLVEGQELTADPLMVAAEQRLGRYRPRLAGHFQARLNPHRSLRGLLFLAALFHDIAKPQSRTVDPDGRIRFFGHDERGARVAADCARRMALSQVEVERVEQIVAHHMRVHLLAMSGELPSRRAIFRYFRASGQSGVDIVLLSLADMLATYGDTLSQEAWERELDTAAALLEGWFDQPSRVVKPPRLLTGTDLMNELHLPPGPQLGRLLDLIREAQATGEVNSRDEALELARKSLE